MRTLAIELAPWRIRVCSVNPAPVKTDMIMNEPLMTLFAGDGPPLSEEEYLAMQGARTSSPRCSTRKTSATRSCSWSPTPPATSPASRCRSTRGFLEKWAVSYDSEANVPDDAPDAARSRW